MQSRIHDVSVSIIGLGERGCRVVQGFETKAPVRTRTVTDADDTTTVLDSIANDRLCFVTGDLDESGVADQFAAILTLAHPYTVALPEGSASGVRPIAEHADWLLPIKTEHDCREWLVQTIRDLCESVLPPTGCELGPADLISAGANRVGCVSVIPLAEASDEPIVKLFAERELSGPDSFLYFFCSADRLDRRVVESRIASLDRPAARAFLWDYRIHPRYVEIPHVKRIISSRVDTETRIQVLQH